MKARLKTTRLSHIRALALDVDGTLTDGGVWWGPDGQEWKRFCFADVMGVARALRAGLSVTLISGEDSPLVDHFAAKLGLADITKGCRDKAGALRAYAERHGYALAEICFMGDDVNDLPAMQLAGYSAAASDAQPEVLAWLRPKIRAQAAHITQAPAVHGAVREFMEALLLARQAASPLKASADREPRQKAIHEPRFTRSAKLRHSARHAAARRPGSVTTPTRSPGPITLPPQPIASIAPAPSAGRTSASRTAAPSQAASGPPSTPAQPKASTNGRRLTTTSNRTQRHQPATPPLLQPQPTAPPS